MTASRSQPSARGYYTRPADATAESIDVAGAAIAYRIDGPAGAPLLVLANSLGTNFMMWDPQMPSLAARFRVLRYDSRGHGVSTVGNMPYTIERLAGDVLALLDHVREPIAHFCGLSVGGMVGMWLGAHAASRIDRLILCNTAPRIGTPARWNARIDAVRRGGLEAIAGGVLDGWFTPKFRERAPETARRLRDMLTATSIDGYLASCAAIRDVDQWDSISAIDRPTLVIAGTHDAPAPPSDGRRMAQTIGGAQYVELDAAHISNVEAADGFNAKVMQFLDN